MFWRNKKNKNNLNNITPSEFLKESVIFLHEKAKSKGFANKGFILNEGLIEIGNPILSEALSIKSNSDIFYLQIATSILQTGVVLGRQCGTDKQSLIDGSFFEHHEGIESMYQELVSVLTQDLHKNIEEWNAFREFIVPLWFEIIKPYEDSDNYEEYKNKLLSAYYLLGISIGLEKYE